MVDVAVKYRFTITVRDSLDGNREVLVASTQTASDAKEIVALLQHDPRMREIEAHDHQRDARSRYYSGVRR